jgi:hypothetical protein
MYIGYSRNKNSYTGGSRYKALFISPIVIKVIDYLLVKKYIEGPKGKNIGTPRQARMRADDKLIELFHRSNLSLPMIDNSTK